ncbi:MAG TPA: response regulator [Bacteroidia bacterium]|nr:response regulator [Bacteroidia bacterium]
MNFIKKLFKSENPKTGIVYIIEDNAVYGKALESFIKSSFPETREVKVFPVGETCLLELNRNPDFIITDYFLDTKYFDAATGLDIIKTVREHNDKMNIIVLSAQKEIDVVLEAVKTYHCSYIKKDEHAFDRVAEILKEASTHP